MALPAVIVNHFPAFEKAFFPRRAKKPAADTRGLAKNAAPRAAAAQSFRQPGRVTGDAAAAQSPKPKAKNASI